jgi:para-nitrobenzyl esterase
MPSNRRGYRGALSAVPWILAAAAVSTPPLRAAAARPEVRVGTGWVSGVAAAGVVSFKGIPYAAPPIGELRWRPPAPPAAWSGVRDGASFGSTCPQMSRSTDWTSSTSEDCLTVNVWKPQRHAAHALPVMVWIHGGAFISGASALPWYDGANLARHDVVVVSLNYRVGRLGFFAHPAITRTAGSDEMLGNYGFMDQVAALEWVQANIAAFGGDPKNVTIFGQSAGGSSVDMLMLAPPAKGLFAKAISQSGFPRWGGKPLRGVANSAEDNGVEFATQNHITGDSAQTAAKLRALPLRDVMESEPPIDIDRTTPEPIVDGRLLVGNAASLLIDGKLAAVPLMLGGTSCDASIFGDDYLASFTFAEPKGQPFESLYRGAPRDATVEALTDRIETEPARFQARAHKATGQPVWVYYFDYKHEPRHAGECAGAPHAADIPFVFGNLAATPLPGMPDQRSRLTTADRRLSKLLMQYWLSFARRGDPNGPGRPHWSAFDLEGEPVMVISSKETAERLNYRKAQLDWIESKLTKPAVW